jgi:hypothetical protein
MVKRLQAAVAQHTVGRVHDDLAAYRLSHAGPHCDAYCVTLGMVADFVVHLGRWVVCG